MFMEYKADLESEHNMRATCSRAQFIYRIVNIRLSGDETHYSILYCCRLSTERDFSQVRATNERRSRCQLPPCVYTRAKRKIRVYRELLLYYSTV